MNVKPSYSPDAMTITDRSGRSFRNLVGVFTRAFPIVVADVRRTGTPGWVRYGGVDYTIAQHQTEDADRGSIRVTE